MQPSDDYDIDYSDDAQLVKFAAGFVSDWFDYYDENIERGRKMRSFTYDDNKQWDPLSIKHRKAKGKSMQTINMIRSIIRQLITENLQNQPQAIISPANSKVSSDQVELKNALYRHICYESNTDMVYSSTYRDQVDLGYGAIGLRVEQDPADHFNTVLRYENIPDATLAVFDPGATDFGKVFGDGCGLLKTVKKSKIRKMYGDDVDINAPSFSMPGKTKLNCAKHSMVCLEFWYREYFKSKKYKVEDDRGNIYIFNSDSYKAEVKRIKQLNKDTQKRIDDAIEQGENIDGISLIQLPKVLQKTDGYDYKIHYALLTSREVLERNELPLKRLPMTFVPGDLRQLGDREITMPFAFDAMVPQQMVNYAYSEIADSINTSIGTRVIAESSTIANNRSAFADPNASKLMEWQMSPALTGLSQPPPPQIVTGPSFDQNLLVMYQQATNDVKMVLGRYDENLGNQTNADSGIAIFRRQMSGNLSVGVYPSNLNRGVAEAAKTALEWMPYVYDTHRDVKTMSKKGKVSFESINVPTDQNSTHNEISKDDAVVHSGGGASFSAQTLSAIEFFMRFTETDPNLKHITYDIIMELASKLFAEGNKIVDRLYTSGYINQDVVKQEKLDKDQVINPSKADEMQQVAMEMEKRKVEMAEKQQKMDHLKSFIEMSTKIKEAEGKVAEKKADFTSDIVSDVTHMISDVSGDLGQIVEARGKAMEQGIYSPEMVEAQGQVSEILDSSTEFLADINDSFQKAKYNREDIT